jgi:hypothetical protein
LVGVGFDQTVVVAIGNAIVVVIRVALVADPVAVAVILVEVIDQGAIVLAVFNAIFIVIGVTGVAPIVAVVIGLVGVAV